MKDFLEEYVSKHETKKLSLAGVSEKWSKKLFLVARKSVVH